MHDRWIVAGTRLRGKGSALLTRRTAYVAGASVLLALTSAGPVLAEEPEPTATIAVADATCYFGEPRVTLEAGGLTIGDGYSVRSDQGGLPIGDSLSSEFVAEATSERLDLRAGGWSTDATTFDMWLSVQGDYYNSPISNVVSVPNPCVGWPTDHHASACGQYDPTTRSLEVRIAADNFVPGVGLRGVASTDHGETFAGDPPGAVVDDSGHVTVHVTIPNPTVNAGTFALTGAKADSTHANGTFSACAGSPPIAPAARTRIDCLKGGWATSTSPRFGNQGDCIRFVTVRKILFGG
jgi:hypothetical protein